MDEHVQMDEQLHVQMDRSCRTETPAELTFNPSQSTGHGICKMLDMELQGRDKTQFQDHA